MSKETPSGLFDELAWEPIATALVRTYADFERDGLKPGADKWSRPNRYNRKMFRSVVNVWAEITGLEDWLFPLSRCAVSLLWINWRKANDRSKADWCQFLDAKFGNEVVAAS